ncbi:MAG: trans-sulfuration enzyme family protein [Candidatus Promineifilaceae bacterium]
MSENKRHRQTAIIRTRIDASGHREQQTALYMTSGFNYEDAESARAVYAGEAPGYVYSRWENPNNDEFLARLCLLEEADSGLTTASGMAAIFTVLAGLLNSGDHVVATRAIFSATNQILERILPRWGIRFSYLDGTAPETWEAAFEPQTRLCFIETPSNPRLELVDIARMSALCRAHEVPLAVDNTFATPILQRPLALGADLVVHSTTKFIDGQGRSIGGAIVGDRFLCDELIQFAHTVGPTLSPFNAWILSQALELLPLRMARHNENGLAVAAWLDEQPGISAVYYPFHAAHPQFELARRQMSGGGGMVSCELAGGLDHGRRFLDALQLCDISPNLGDSRTIVTHPASTTHSKLSAAQREAAGISPGLVRISVGLEHVDDIIADLSQALAAAG